MSMAEAAQRPVSRWVLTTAIAGTVGIALGAFWLSFTALASLTALAGVPVWEAWVWPLIVDGIIVVATISVVALSPHGRRAMRYPWSLLFAGAIVSVTANTTHALVATDAAVPKPLAACVSGGPTRRATGHHASDRRVDPPHPQRCTRQRRCGAGSCSRAQGDSVRVLAESGGDPRTAAVQLRHSGWFNRRIARELGVHPSTIGRWLPAAIESVGGEPPSGESDGQRGSSLQ